MKKENAKAADDLAEMQHQYFGRDRSWLDFNERVLHLSTDPSVPLFERIRFLTIFSSNLDEFFMKRFALLRRRLRLGIDSRSSDGLTLRQRFTMLRRRVLEMQTQLADILNDDIRKELEASGINIVQYDALKPAEVKRLSTWFQESVFPVLTPLSVDPGHRFPFISNLSTNLGVLLSHPIRKERHFARLKIPELVPQ